MTHKEILELIKGHEFEMRGSLHIIEHRYIIGEDTIQLFWDGSSTETEPDIHFNGEWIKSSSDIVDEYVKLLEKKERVVIKTKKLLEEIAALDTEAKNYIRLQIKSYKQNKGKKFFTIEEDL